MPENKTRSVIEQNFVDRAVADFERDVRISTDRFIEELAKKYLGPGRMYILHNATGQIKDLLIKEIQYDVENAADEKLKKVGSALYEDLLNEK